MARLKPLLVNYSAISVCVVTSASGSRFIVVAALLDVET